ncbi:hypothetical protein ACHAXA_010457 [Cyclostephanos tholiformis]|uniref:Conserved oligomeric Golgi complex subunit 5 helical domain-containing protein n=1 Tax=Cyclostephanos tholiformis TaxID=382380 RepID=A0ABD3SFK6_9STRA
MSNNTIGSGAAHALALLLREDPLLVRHGLVVGGGGLVGVDDGNNDVINSPAHSYASSLLHVGGHNPNKDASSSSSSSSSTSSSSSSSAKWMTSSGGEYRQRATEALAEVDRKLALVESLSVRISREAPEMVAGPLLRSHGFDLASTSVAGGGSLGGGRGEVAASSVAEDRPAATTTTLVASRDKAERIARQSQLLDVIARRVESTLLRGATRMESATSRLSRVLSLSATLKMMLRLQFEARKVLHAGVGLDSAGIVGGQSSSSSSSSSSSYRLDAFVDLRDLTRAAASVAAMEGLLAHPSLTPENDGDGSERIDVVERLRPRAKAVATIVRRSAAGLMDELQGDHPTASGTAASLTRLGATLQVYFHLGELPEASWKAVSSALAATEKASSQLFHPTALKKMKEAAQAEAKASADAESSAVRVNDDGDSSKKSVSESNNPRQRKKQYEATYDRLYQRKLREKRAAAALAWSTSVFDAASRVWNLHRVLARRNDPVSRKNFLEVISESPVPAEFSDAERRLLALQNRNSGSIALSRSNFSLFSLFWMEMSIGLGGRISRLIKYDNGSLEGDVAALFPAVRSASLSMVTELYDIMQMGLSSSAVGDSSVSGLSSTVLGGSDVLEDSVFFGGSNGGGTLGAGLDSEDYFDRADEAAGGGGGFFGASADAWTHIDSNSGGTEATQGLGTASSASSSLTTAVFTSPEWLALQGDNADGISTGLSALQTAFLKECKNRLFAPLDYLFPEAVSVDENGIAIPCLPTLPTRYDLAKLDANIREELSFADPRQGGGDFSMAPMISDVVVEMLIKFCLSARRAISECEEGRILDSRSGSIPESMAHNLSVAGVMNSLASFVRNAPENTFVYPYRPAQSTQHEEASHSCRMALLPALKEIDSLVKTSILDPLCRAMNRLVFTALVKMHRGTYLQESIDATSQPSSFVQLYLADQYDNIACTYLAQLPNEYAIAVASTVAMFSIYSFVSNAALLRPLGETSRLRLTQDLADFELALEQFVFKGGTSLSLSQIADGKPYAELRAFRQLLYWTALEDKTLSPAEVAKGLLRDTWVKDLRPSTLFHFLFSFAPARLTSPHHFKRMDAGEYVGALVKLNGSVEDGEASAWMTTMACCDSYQQRESLDGAITDGDRRIGALLMVLGPELLRRRRQ